MSDSRTLVRLAMEALERAQAATSGPERYHLQQEAVRLNHLAQEAALREASDPPPSEDEPS